MESIEYSDVKSLEKQIRDLKKIMLSQQSAIWNIVDAIEDGHDPEAYKLNKIVGIINAHLDRKVCTKIF
ncbi:MAG: hypothetical protein JST70_12565 [Bacteroidetes bacterium]|nr:hypothetical protein [Bacteroidota bacterium]